MVGKNSVKRLVATESQVDELRSSNQVIKENPYLKLDILEYGSQLSEGSKAIIYGKEKDVAGQFFAGYDDFGVPKFSATKPTNDSDEVLGIYEKHDSPQRAEKTRAWPRKALAAAIAVGLVAPAAYIVADQLDKNPFEHIKEIKMPGYSSVMRNPISNITFDTNSTGTENGFVLTDYNGEGSVNLPSSELELDGKSYGDILLKLLGSANGKSYSNLSEIFGQAVTPGQEMVFTGSYSGLQVTEYSTGNITTYDNGTITFSTNTQGVVTDIVLTGPDGQAVKIVSDVNLDIDLESEDSTIDQDIELNGTSTPTGNATYNEHGSQNGTYGGELVLNGKIKIGSLRDIQVSTTPDGAATMKEIAYDELGAAYALAIATGAAGAGLIGSTTERKTGKEDADTMFSGLVSYLKDASMLGTHKERLISGVSMKDALISKKVLDGVSDGVKRILNSIEGEAYCKNPDYDQFDAEIKRFETGALELKKDIKYTPNPLKSLKGAVVSDIENLTEKYRACKEKFDPKFESEKTRLIAREAALNKKEANYAIHKKELDAKIAKMEETEKIVKEFLESRA